MWLQFPLLKREATSEALRHAGHEEYRETKETQVMQLYIHLGSCTEIRRRLMGKTRACLADSKHYRSCVCFQLAYL